MRLPGLPPRTDGRTARKSAGGQERSGRIGIRHAPSGYRAPEGRHPERSGNPRGPLAALEAFSLLFLVKALQPLHKVDHIRPIGLT